MWALLLAVVNPAMYQLHRELNPFCLGRKPYFFSKEDYGVHFVTHCIEVSDNEPCPFSSSASQNQLSQVINDAPSLVTGGGMKARLRASDTPKAPTQRDTAAEAPFPGFDAPFSKAQAEAHNT